VHPNKNNNGTKALQHHAKACLPRFLQGQKRASKTTLEESIAKVRLYPL
jgi:hypothetical protein